MDLLKIVVGIFAVYVALKVMAYFFRRQRLMSKYGDREVVRRIMKKTIWEGMTTDQLHDCLGKPLDVDERLTKRAHTRVLKYRRTGRGRYGTRVTVREGRVIGWDVK